MSAESPSVFLIPGLGFTGELFSQLDLEPAQLHSLKWIDPLKKESIAAYASRMAEPVRQSGQAPILIGHSFGGIVAQEIAAQVPVRRIILISSIKSHTENTLSFKAVAPLGLHHLFTRFLTLKTFRYWAKPFGYESPEEQDLFLRMVGAQHDTYLKWALKMLSKWKGVAQNVPVTHLHGDRDKTFPFRRIQEPVHRIKGGNHMMVWNRAGEISEEIRKYF